MKTISSKTTKKLLAAALVATLFTTSAAAQTHSIIFSLDSDEVTLINGNGLVEAGLLRQDEVGIVTPVPGLYSAYSFLTMSTQWAYLGDADSDGRYADDSVEAPGDRVDAIMVRLATPSPLSGRAIFISKETAEGFAAASFEDGDVFRFVGPTGALEFFVTETQLLTAIGQAATADLDTDAIAQGPGGDLFVSFADDELVNGISAPDGSLIYIPAASITYDANLNVASIASGAAIIAATEAQMSAMMIASGVRTSVGGVPSLTELTALEIDPAGGTFAAPNSPSNILPNLLFAWNGFSNDGAILSTAGGGTIPTINGIPLADSVATTGLQIGVLPTSTGIFGIDGLAIVPFQPNPFVLENYPRNLITSQPSWHRFEFSGATPGSLVFVLADAGPAGAGSALPSLDLPPYGELFIALGGGGVILGSSVADVDGFADLQLLFNDPILNGLNIVIQGFDFTTQTLSAPAAIQFL
ncbi:MAG: hypothetical protein ACKVS6_02190 [Planctomycetota bacterium]